MSKQGEFLVCCLKVYKAARTMTGKQSVEFFKQYGTTDYVTSCYAPLHTTGTKYIAEDIDFSVEAHQVEL